MQNVRGVGVEVGLGKLVGDGHHQLERWKRPARALQQRRSPFLSIPAFESGDTLLEQRARVA